MTQSMTRRTHAWEGIRSVLAAVGRAQVAVLFWVAYVVVWMPAGFVMRACADWLRRRAPAGSNLWPRSPRLNDPSHVHDQF